MDGRRDGGEGREREGGREGGREGNRGNPSNAG